MQSPISSLGVEATVSNLIDLEKGRWNSNVIRDNFSEEEANVIVNIPLSPSFPPDILFWIGTSNGIFSVRSAYHLRKEIKDRENGQCSYSVKDPGLWKAIWAMKVPNPVKLFTWRACHNLLPTRHNLFQRKVVNNPSCPCCGREA